MGPVLFQTRAADVRYVHWAGQEIIRRIFVTVRDDDWREVVPTEWVCTTTRDTESLELQFTARHEDESVGFAWQGTFTVKPKEGALSFALTGRVLRDMDVNRVGLVVLHPADELVGNLIRVSGPNGTESAEIDEQLHPQHIVDGLPTGMTRPFDRLTTVLRTGEVRFAFTGDLFEIEDQRNFGDSSFKSYCPPLAEGFPRHWTASTEVAWSVKCDVDLRAAESTCSGDVLTIGARCERRLPSLGFRATGEDFSLPTSIFGHVRVDVRADASAQDLDFIKGLLEAETRLELGLIASSEAAHDEQVVEICADSHVTRVLLLECGQTVACPGLVEDLCAALKDHGCVAPMYPAIDGYFVEINRGDPIDLSGSGLAIAACPTVHSGDILTVAENVAALPDLVETARALFPQQDVVVSPLTLRQGPAPDPNVYDVVALPWVVASVETLSRSAVPSVTLGSDVLPGPAAVPTWTAVLELLHQTYRAPYLLDVEPLALLHVIAWKDDSDDVSALLANLADYERCVAMSSGQTLMDARVLYGSDPDGERPSNALAVPAYGVVSARVRL